MRAFAYVAYTREGKRRTGSVVAENERAALEQLQGKGLFPSEIRAGAVAAGPVRRGRSMRLDLDERAIFCRQMAVLLAASLSKEQALDAVIGSEGSARLHAFSAWLKAGVLEGRGLADLVGQARAGFPGYCIASLRAGEASGRLAEVFERLAEHQENQGNRKSVLATALVYPAFVGLVSLLVCGVLVTQIAPELQVMFQAANRPLPDLTQAVLGISGAVQRHAVLILLLLAAAVAGAVLAWRAPGPRDAIQRAALRLPVLGRLMRLAMAAEYLRTLALVLGSRQTVQAAVASAAEVLALRSAQGEAREVLRAVTEGESLAAALTRLPLLPGIVLQMVRVGEETAQVARMADRAAMVLETRLDTERKRLVAVLDPALMVLVGAFVLVVVLAVLLPIFELQSVVAG